MDFGTAWHCAVLEPEEYARQYVVCPHDGRTKAGKDWKELHADSKILSVVECELIKSMRYGIGENVKAVLLLECSGTVEESYFWTDIITGVECRCRPDKIVEIGGRVIVLDLKTTQDASPAAFAKSIAQFGYHRQQYFYTAGLRENGIDVDEWYFVVSEKTAPHETAIYTLDPGAVAVGEYECQNALDRFNVCKTRNSWPGLGDRITTVSLPTWYK